MSETARGLGEATREFLIQRLRAAEDRRAAAPVGSVARDEATREARQIRRILEEEGAEIPAELGR